MKGLQLLPFELGCVDCIVHVLKAGLRQTLYPCDEWPVLHSVFVMSNFIFGFSSCSPCKFKPTQFNHFTAGIWMLWGKHITTMKWNHHFLDKSSSGHKSGLLENLTFLFTDHTEKRKGDVCTGEKTIHAEISIFRPGLPPLPTKTGKDALNLHLEGPMGRTKICQVPSFFSVQRNWKCPHMNYSYHIFCLKNSVFCQLPDTVNGKYTFSQTTQITSTSVLKHKCANTPNTKPWHVSALYIPCIMRCLGLLLLKGLI